MKPLPCRFGPGSKSLCGSGNIRSSLCWRGQDFAILSPQSAGWLRCGVGLKDLLSFYRLVRISRYAASLKREARKRLGPESGRVNPGGVRLRPSEQANGMDRSRSSPDPRPVPSDRSVMYRPGRRNGSEVFAVKHRSTIMVPFPDPK